MKFLKVSKKQAEHVRKELVAAGLFSNDYEIIHEDNSILFPVLDNFKSYEMVEMKGEKRVENQGKLKDALAGVLTTEERESLVSSFDILGNIAIIEIPESLEQKEKQIGDAVISANHHVKTVLKKTGPMEGEFRVRQVEHISGENTKIAIYKESGVLMKFDVSKVYFSVRLAFERSRIAELVKPGELVLVLFAGVGPFALVIAKKHPDTKIITVELNPEAVVSMKENIKLNKMKNIEATEGDAPRIWQKSKKQGKIRSNYYAIA
ncbi:MAG: methyltransferase [Candidatus Micrarchaeota archaeon]